MHRIGNNRNLSLKAIRESSADRANEIFSFIYDKSKMPKFNFAVREECPGVTKHAKYHFRKILSHHNLWNSILSCLLSNKFSLCVLCQHSKSSESIFFRIKIQQILSKLQFAIVSWARCLLVSLSCSSVIAHQFYSIVFLEKRTDLRRLIHFILFLSNLHSRDF